MKRNWLLAVLILLTALSAPAIVFKSPLQAAEQDLRGDLAKAVKIGSGKTMVIEFTDPDCPFCRKASEYFAMRNDVTRYVYFNPLPMHPTARDKAVFILSAQDKAKAYEEVMSGRYDLEKVAGLTPNGAELLEEHQKIARNNKVDSTPTLIICGRIIEGFDLKLIEKMLNPG